MKEKCFGADPKREGYCKVLTKNGKGDLKCEGYGEYSYKHETIKCSFYKTKDEFKEGVGR